MDLPRLLVLTDRSQLHLGRSLTRTVSECVAAGATHVVVRELDETELARTALAAACEAAGASVIAAHTPLFGCAGVQLAADQPVPEGLVGRQDVDARHSGTDRSAVPWGRSCHSVEEVRAAAAEGASWVTLGPFAATASKPGYAALDRAVFAEAAEVGIHVYALGGITADNVAEAVAAGADGVAVMGSVMRAEDPAAVVAALLDVLEEAPW